ncbi:hypothetical protein V6Z11_A12G239000 [Gossypium hirsutum]
MGRGWCKDEECQRHVGGATGAEAAGMTHMGSGAEILLTRSFGLSRANFLIVIITCNHSKNDMDMLEL